MNWVNPIPKTIMLEGKNHRTMCSMITSLKNLTLGNTNYMYILEPPIYVAKTINNIKGLQKNKNDSFHLMVKEAGVIEERHTRDTEEASKILVMLSVNSGL